MSATFIWPVRVYYEDTDAGGVVYHANYLKYLERARTERLRAIGLELDELRRAHGLLFVVKSAQLDFRKPAWFNDQILVSADIVEFKRASLTFDQTIQRDGPSGETLCAASIRIACLTEANMRPAAMPPLLWETLHADC